MTQIPKSITTDIERDYPGRFVVEEVELHRLLDDIRRLLKKEGSQHKLETMFWVRLASGIFYRTTDLDDILREENSRRRKIMLLVIFAEIISEENEVIRRIVVQLSRGEPLSRINRLEHIRGESFNINYCGLNYRVRDQSRESAMEVMDQLEERLAKFRRWYSSFPSIPITPRSFVFNVVISLVFTLLIYILATIVPGSLRSVYSVPIFTEQFLQSTAVAMVSLVIIAVIAYALLCMFNWFLPPTYFAIGDEVGNHKSELLLRQFILGTIILGLILEVIGGFLQEFVRQLLGIGYSF